MLFQVSPSLFVLSEQRHRNPVGRKSCMGSNPSSDLSKSSQSLRVWLQMIAAWLILVQGSDCTDCASCTKSVRKRPPAKHINGMYMDVIWMYNRYYTGTIISSYFIPGWCPGRPIYINLYDCEDITGGYFRRMRPVYASMGWFFVSCWPPAFPCRIGWWESFVLQLTPWPSYAAFQNRSSRCIS